MPPKIKFTPETDVEAVSKEPVDFTPEIPHPEGDSFNVNDVIKLKPYQMGSLSLQPSDITTGPNLTINPITQRPNENEGFWSKALNLPEARKTDRGDASTFSSGLDYSKIGDLIKQHPDIANGVMSAIGGILPGGSAITNLLNPETKTKVAAKLGELGPQLVEGALADPISPSLGLLHGPSALDGRLKSIRETPVEPLPAVKPPMKLLPPHTGMIADDIGNVVPNKLVPGPLGNKVSPDVAARSLTDFPDTLRHELSGGIPDQGRLTELPSAIKGVEQPKKIDFVPDNTAAAQSDVEPVLQQELATKPTLVNRPKDAPPNQRAKIMRGAHDPVDVIFADPFDREVFGSGQRLSGKLNSSNTLQRFGNTSNKIAERYGLSEQESRSIVNDYNQNIRDLTKAQPPQFEGAIGRINAPSLDEFIAARKSAKPTVTVTPGLISQSTTDKLANLAKGLLSETEGSFKPQELVEGTKKALLKLRGKSTDEVDTIRTQLLSHLVDVGRIDVNAIYGQVKDKLSPTQFDKVLNDIIDSGDLQKAYKSKTASQSSVQPATANQHPVSLQDSLNSLSDAVEQHQAARAQQDEIVRGEKSNRAAKLEDLKGQGYSGYQQQREALKGEYSKVNVQPIKDAASSVNMDAMMNMIDDKLPNQFEAFRAKQAVAKVFGMHEMKGALQPNEIDLLNKVYGPELTAKLQQMNSVFGMPDAEYSQVGKDIAKYSNLAKSIQSSMDLSAPLRQGAPLMLRKEFYPAFRDMFKFAGSENQYKALNDYLENDWKYKDLAKASKLSITQIGSDMKNLPMEEHFLSSLPEKVPVLGKLYRGSERAYVGFLDKLRADTFSSLVDDMQRAGIKTHDVVKVNTRDGVTNKIIPSKEVMDTAKFVNTATGRGSLGAAEKYGDLLNTIFYSPRFQASRLDLMTKFLRPDTYTKLSPALRKEYLKSLLSMGGVASVTAGLGAAMGGKLTADPKSSDFGKVVYHNTTRQDPGAGFLQYLTLAAREITNQTTSTNTGKTSTLGAKFGSPDRMDILSSFARNKLSPIPGLAVTALKGKNNVGEPFDATSDTAKLFVPLLMQDINDILKNDPKAWPLIAPATLGQGIQVYEDLKKKKAKQSGSFLGRELRRTN